MSLVLDNRSKNLELNNVASLVVKNDHKLIQVGSRYQHDKKGFINWSHERQETLNFVTN
jgi:hypothetical protein